MCSSNPVCFRKISSVEIGEESFSRERSFEVVGLNASDIVRSGGVQGLHQ